MAYKNKSDMATYHREVWYPKNKQRRAELNKKWREENTRVFKEWKAKQKCILCGESESCCLDLHHLDPTKKEYAIAATSRFTSFKNLQKELEKCVVVCANCHRKIHAGVAQVEEQLLCNE